MNRRIIIAVCFGLSLINWMHAAENPQKELVNSKNQLLQNDEINKDPQASVIARSLISIHTRVFGINSLLTQWGSPEKKKEDIAQWDILLNQLQTYLQKNNPAILPEFQKLALISRQLIADLTTIYSKYIMPLMPVSKKDGGFDLTDLNNIDMTANLKPDVLAGLHDALGKSKLISIQARVNILDVKPLDDIMSTLNQKIQRYQQSHAIGSRQKRIATQILSYFADIVKTTTIKIKNDLIRLEKAQAAEITYQNNIANKTPVAPPKLPSVVDKSAIYSFEKKAWKDETRWPGHTGWYYPQNNSWYFEGRGWWSDEKNGWWDATQQKWISGQQSPVPPRFEIVE